jgi:hypothetical protein
VKGEHWSLSGIEERLEPGGNLVVVWS